MRTPASARDASENRHGWTLALPIMIALEAYSSGPQRPTLSSRRDAELLYVLILPDFERADRIGEFWGYPGSRAFAELLIDCEEDRTLRVVLVGMLRESQKPC